MEKLPSPSEVVPEVSAPTATILDMTEEAVEVHTGREDQEHGVSDLRGDFHNLSFLSTGRSDSSMNTLTNWLNNIKADDIDGGLAADFDGSLSGLGVELGSSTYNMSEALLALPVFKQENSQHTTVVEPNFQYILGAVTSPATKLYEETLTYLNQGQSYELRLKALGSATSPKGQRLKSSIRVVFHERRLQYMEREQMTCWKQQRPGDRILDIDIPLSYGLIDVEVSPQRLNTVQVVWDPSKDTGIFIKVNCISTEFTAKKHGGEKGVPFRVQVETYLHDSSEATLQHCASCQVKVFKPKGADRKNKTDKEKIEKRSEVEKEKYQPSYACTVLTEIPLDQVCQYLEQLQKEVEDDTQPQPSSPPEVSSPKVTPVSPKRSISRSPSVSIQEDANHGNSTPKASPHPPIIPTTLQFNISSPAPTQTPTSDTISNTKSPSATDIPVTPLLSTATAHQVTLWLHKNRFSAFVKVFQNFAGADLLRLSRDDLIQICGLADGIRLNNALQSKTVRPKLTIFIYQPAPAAGTRRRSRQVSGTSRNNSNSGSISPALDTDLTAGSGPTPLSGSSTLPTQSSTGLTSSTKYTQPQNMAPSQTSTVMAPTVQSPCPRTPQSPSQRVPQSSPPQHVSSVRASETNSATKVVKVHRVKAEGLDTSQVEQRKSAVTKRQYANETDEQDEEEPACYFKKQRTRNLELSRKEVYHAIYLEHLLLEHLVLKLAALFSISSLHSMEIHVREPSGIDVLVTDTVVQNLGDLSRYSVEAFQDENHSNIYNVLLIKQT